MPDVGKILPLVSGWAFEARGHNCGSRCAMGGKCNFHNVQDTCISSKRPPPAKELISRTCGSRATLRRFRVLPELPCHVTASLSTQQVHAAHNRCRLLFRYNRQPSRTHLLGSSQKVASWPVSSVSGVRLFFLRISIFFSFFLARVVPASSVSLSSLLSTTFLVRFLWVNWGYIFYAPHGYRTGTQRSVSNTTDKMLFEGSM